MLLSTALIALLSIVTLFAAKASKNKKQHIVKFDPVTTERLLLSLEEIDRLKDYADIFGVDSSTHNLCAEKLLEMGRKAEQYLGADKVQEIVHTVRKSRTVPNQSTQEGDNHRINTLIRISSMMIKTIKAVRTYIMRGVEEDEERKTI